MSGDAVNHPAHYKGGAGLEAIQVIEAFDLGFHLGNVVKYVLRAGKKDDAKKDLRKAAWYLARKLSSITAEDEGYAPDDPANYSLCYLATPYTKWSDLDAAAVLAARLNAALFERGIATFSPIALGHQLAVHGGLPPRDGVMWAKFCDPYVDACDAMIVAHLPGWNDSTGIAAETDAFTRQGKPIFDLDPQTFTIVRRMGAA